MKIKDIDLNNLSEIEEGFIEIYSDSYSYICFIKDQSPTDLDSYMFYSMNKEGLSFWFNKSNDNSDDFLCWICSPIKVVDVRMKGESSPFFIVEFIDMFGDIACISLLFVDDIDQHVRYLRESGFVVSSRPEARQALKDYLMLSLPIVKMRRKFVKWR